MATPTPTNVINSASKRPVRCKNISVLFSDMAYMPRGASAEQVKAEYNRLCTTNPDKCKLHFYRFNIEAPNQRVAIEAGLTKLKSRILASWENGDATGKPMSNSALWRVGCVTVKDFSRGKVDTEAQKKRKRSRKNGPVVSYNVNDKPTDN